MKVILFILVINNFVCFSFPQKLDFVEEITSHFDIINCDLNNDSAFIFSKASADSLTNIQEGYLLGVYYTDLLLSINNGQTQISIKYLSKINNASKALGISNDKGISKLLDKLEENISNESGFKSLCMSFFFDNYKGLKSNSIKTKVAIGALIETIFIFSCLYDCDQNKNSLNTLIKHSKSILSLLKSAGETELAFVTKTQIETIEKNIIPVLNNNFTSQEILELRKVSLEIRNNILTQIQKNQ